METARAVSADQELQTLRGYVEAMYGVKPSLGRTPVVGLS